MLNGRDAYSARALAILLAATIAKASAGYASITVTDATITSSLVALDALLPPDPGLPDPGPVCATLSANVASASFSSPTATAPAVDDAAAVAPNPTNSIPDTVRIQSACLF